MNWASQKLTDPCFKESMDSTCYSLYATYKRIFLNSNTTMDYNLTFRQPKYGYIRTRYAIEHNRVKTLPAIYLVRVSEIGRYFSWLLPCDRACPVQPPAFFLSRVLLLGFGKLLSIKKKCHCRFVVMCVGFTTNLQNESRSKSLPPDIHPLLFYTPRPTQ